MKTALRVLAASLLGGVVFALAAVAYLATERCAGPACAGLAIIPVLAGGAGVVVGALGGLGYVVFVRPKPMPKAFRDEAARRPPPGRPRDS